MSLAYCVALMAGSTVVILNFPLSSRVYEPCGRIRLVEVLHVEIKARIVLLQEYRSEDEYQDYRERNREEHRGFLA